MLKHIPANAQHIGARDEQQDSFAFSDPSDQRFVAHGGLLGIIADGMGGLEGGRQASSAAVTTFLHAYSSKTQEEPIPVALRRSMAEANAAVTTIARQLGTEGGTGTTLVAMVTHGRSLYWVSAGDSRLYVVRQGALARVNADHTYGAGLWPQVAASRVDRQQALADPQAGHLTSYLGLPKLPLVDLSLRAFPLQPNDIVLACTDGIYRSLSESEMAMLATSSEPGPACEAIKAATLKKARPHQDNLTVIAVYHIDDATPPSVERVIPSAPPPLPPPRRFPLAMVLGLEILAAAGLAWFASRGLLSGNKPPAHIPTIQNNSEAAKGHTKKPSTTQQPPTPDGAPAPGAATPPSDLPRMDAPAPKDGVQPPNMQKQDKSPAPATPSPPPRDFHSLSGNVESTVNNASPNANPQE